MHYLARSKSRLKIVGSVNRTVSQFCWHYLFEERCMYCSIDKIEVIQLIPNWGIIVPIVKHNLNVGTDFEVNILISESKTKIGFCRSVFVFGLVFLFLFQCVWYKNVYTSFKPSGDMVIRRRLYRSPTAFLKVFLLT